MIVFLISEHSTFVPHTIIVAISKRGNDGRSCNLLLLVQVELFKRQNSKRSHETVHIYINTVMWWIETKIFHNIVFRIKSLRLPNGFILIIVKIQSILFVYLFFAFRNDRNRLLRTDNIRAQDFSGFDLVGDLEEAVEQAEKHAFLLKFHQLSLVLYACHGNMIDSRLATESLLISFHLAVYWYFLCGLQLPEGNGRRLHQLSMTPHLVYIGLQWWLEVLEVEGTLRPPGEVCFRYWSTVHSP